MHKLCKLTITLTLSLLGLSLQGHAEETLRDPTQPPAYENTYANLPNNDVNITAVFTGKNPRVIIGNHVFIIGDKIADATITAIDTKGITLTTDGGKENKIAMIYSTIKTPIIKNEKEAREKIDQKI
ncbi:MAG: hypothetical protein KKE11_05780 [Gammaproteobacteria bacterium]|nr:hypothetical protein [Gammaproteobacteria bacterium]